MIRTLSAPAVLAALGLTLAACQPGGGRDVGETAQAGDQTTSRPAGEPVPASDDWNFVPHGGSGDLDFGDGDWSEGVSLFGMSCLPNSKTVEMNWGYQEVAVLTSGTATGTFQPGARVATDDPVITALKASGAIDVGLSGGDMRLVAKDTGKAAIADFFDYCDKGIDPRYTAEAIAAAEAELAAAETATAMAPAADAAPAVEAVAPVAEAPKT